MTKNSLSNTLKKENLDSRFIIKSIKDAEDNFKGTLSMKGLACVIVKPWAIVASQSIGFYSLFY